MKFKPLFPLLLFFFSFLVAGSQHVTTIQEMYTEYQKSFPTVPTVSVKQTLQWIKKGQRVIMVDIRTEKEQQISVIPGALTQKEFEEHKEVYRQAKIVTYCTIGSRSGKYAKRIQEEGYKVYNLKGSILMWAHENQPLIDQTGPTKRVHVFGEKWNLLPEGYEAIW